MEGRGKKCVNFLRSFQDPSKKTTVPKTNSKSERVKMECPSVIQEYNDNMGGVDKFD